MARDKAPENKRLALGRPQLKKVVQNNSRAAKTDINGIIGASGSGKTSYVMAEIKRRKPGRLLVWDTKGEFAREGYGQAVTTAAELMRLLRAAGRSGRFAICYRPRGDAAAMKRQFNIFCLGAFYAKNVFIVAEELSDVTTASHAPEGWRKITTQGRTEGLIIYGLSQSPAQIDKDFFGNCSRVRTGRLNFDSHIKALANCMSVSKDEIKNLLPGAYIERDMNTGQIRKGKLF